MELNDAISLATLELIRATRVYGPINSSHEGYAVIKEELEELWEDVKSNNREGMRDEAAQIAAIALRFLMDICEVEYMGLTEMKPD